MRLNTCRLVLNELKVMRRGTFGYEGSSSREFPAYQKRSRLGWSTEFLTISLSRKNRPVETRDYLFAIVIFHVDNRVKFLIPKSPTRILIINS